MTQCRFCNKQVDGKTWANDPRWNDRLTKKTYMCARCHQYWATEREDQLILIIKKEKLKL